MQQHQVLRTITRLREVGIVGVEEELRLDHKMQEEVKVEGNYLNSIWIMLVSALC